MKEIFILSGARTPFTAWSSGVNGKGEKGGKLKPYDPFDLGAAALKGAISRSGLEASALDRLVFGNMYHVGPHACYGARYVGHRAGLTQETPCLTVSCACGTGLQAVISASREIVAGGSQVCGTGGTDNASLIQRKVFVPSFIDISCGLHIAKTAEDLAKEYGFSREDQDRWALRSHSLALKAHAARAEEIIPVGEVTEDDAILSEPTLKHFSDAELFFKEEGRSVTHANIHGVVDGASALILASGKGAKDSKTAPLGRLLAGEYVGLAPKKMAYASVPAIHRALGSAGLDISDIDLFEINETFAAQVLIDVKELDIPQEKVNVNGGAIALGHPFAGSGCRMVLSLLGELRRRRLKRGVASICVGGAQGIAVVVETL